MYCVLYGKNAVNVRITKFSLLFLFIYLGLSSILPHLLLVWVWKTFGFTGSWSQVRDQQRDKAVMHVCCSETSPLVGGVTEQDGEYKQLKWANPTGWSLIISEGLGEVLAEVLHATLHASPEERSGHVRFMMRQMFSVAECSGLEEGQFNIYKVILLWRMQHVV